MDDIELQRKMVEEMRTLFEEIKAERATLFQVVISHGDLAMLCHLADLLDEQRQAKAVH